VRKVLVVDDEPGILDTVRRVLGQRYALTTVRNAAEALALLRLDPLEFDAVLCDLHMPGINGIAFHEELTRMDPALAAKIIFMTSGVAGPLVAALGRLPNPKIDKLAGITRLAEVLAHATKHDE
jgi:CheY-like chemotaxis protein